MCPCVYAGMCVNLQYLQSYAHSVIVTCHWQVESTYVTTVVRIVTGCVHAVWLFAVLITGLHNSSTSIFLSLSMIVVIYENLITLGQR